MRLLVVLAGICAWVAMAAPAGAATPSLKAQYKPVYKEITQEGTDIGAALRGASTQTDLELAKVFRGLARRAGASAVKVGKLRGARGANLITQRQLALALAKGASDLSRIAVALQAHNANNARAATLALVGDSKPITTGRTRLAKALGIA